MIKPKQTTFYCFSPPVMLATFVIEIACAIYVYMRYKADRLQRLTICMLTLLATFQIAEYNVCGRFGLDSNVWSRIGYVAITLLPPLGLHITHVLAGKKIGRMVYASYGTALLFSGVFALGSQAFESYACGGNYVIFQLKNPLGGLFFIYYYIWLLSSIYLAMVWAKKAKPRIRKALTVQVAGYAAFMFPTSVAILLFPKSASALPSVMCGFAVIYALVLGFLVVPIAQNVPAKERA